MRNDAQTTVVIMGAGIAGMCAAKILSQRPGRIILIDRDFAPVAQASQLHVLLAKGQLLLKAHFPAVYAKIQANCPEVNWGDETYWRTPAGPLPKRRLNVSTYLLSRPYLDGLMLDDLRQSCGCEFIQDTVKDLCLSGGKTSVESVALASGRQIPCDICIDSLGRNSISKKICEREFGLPVAKDEVRTALRYYSMTAHRKTAGEYKQAYYQIDPAKECYGGVISPVEEGRMIATFISIDQSHEPPDNPFLLIKDETFQKFVSEMEIDSRRTAFGQLHNIRHHFENYSALPTNLYVIGDSVCQLNPVFGQGMTLALQSAEMLGEFLEAGGMKSRRFQKQVFQRTKFPWLIATLDPYNQAIAPSWTRRICKSLLYRAIKKSKSHSHMHHSLVEVLHMLKNPKRLLSLRNFFQ